MQTENIGVIKTHQWPQDSAVFDVDLIGFNEAYTELEKVFKE
jgi:hypothetical protein